MNKIIMALFESQLPLHTIAAVCRAVINDMSAPLCSTLNCCSKTKSDYLISI